MVQGDWQSLSRALAGFLYFYYSKCDGFVKKPQPIQTLSKPFIIIYVVFSVGAHRL